MELSIRVPLKDEDDRLTPAGRAIASAYAQALLAGYRRLDLERKAPSLQDLFSDLRSDRALRDEWAN